MGFRLKLVYVKKKKKDNNCVISGGFVTILEVQIPCWKHRYKYTLIIRIS